MIRLIYLALSLTILMTSAPLLKADTGVLDKYECHNHQRTGQYHCHGSGDLAKLGGFVLSADSRLQGWIADNRASLFTGLGINVEYTYRWFGITAGYLYLPLIDAINNNNVSLDESVAQRGWEVGLKAGLNVGRIGKKVYLLGGLSSAEIKADNADYNETLNSYFVGLGSGYNSRKIAMDIAATYRDPEVIRSYARGKLDVNADGLYVFDIRLSVGWRF